MIRGNMTIPCDRNDKLVWILIVFPCIVFGLIDSCDAFNTKLPAFRRNTNKFYQSRSIYRLELKATDNKGEALKHFNQSNFE